jgi:betaine-aldehyde dehydrogenase
VFQRVQVRVMTGLRTAQHWIGGGRVDGAKWADSTDLATSQQIGTYTEAGEAEAIAAITAAQVAFRSSPWRHDRHLRARVLNAMADRFEQRASDLVAMLSLENGRIRSEAQFEVGMVPSTLRFYAATALTEFGRAVEAAPGRYSTTLRQAMGVTGIISPRNSPVVLFIRSLAPALAAGCTVVAKLPGFTAQTNALVCEILAEVTSMPSGVVNVFNEVCGSAARTVVASPDVPVISLTGSSKTGQAIMAAGIPHMKRFGGELGDRTPILLFEDADLDKALPVVEGADHVCRAVLHDGQPPAVQRSNVDTVRDRLGRLLAAVRLGPAADPASEMGPMINMANVQRVDGMVEAAIAAGARVVICGGPFTEGSLAQGAFHRPTLLEIEDHRQPIAQDAVALANDSQYGLAASVWSTNVDRPLRIARQIEAGTVWINTWAVVHDESEGGYKQCGLGRLNGLSALDDFVEYRTFIHDLAV